MCYRRRRGNILITVAVFFILVLTFSSLFSLSGAIKANARAKTQNAGDASSYVTLANLCADAFRHDLECQSAQVATASVDNPNGDYGLEVYDKAAQEIQKGLSLQKNDDGTWQHTLTNPEDMIAYTGITDSDIIKYASKLLENAKVAITVQSDFRIVGTDITSEDSLQNGSQFRFDDIYYKVILTKGTWKISQEYLLKNEALVGHFDETLIGMTVNGEQAENELIRQTVTSQNIV